MRAGDVPLPPKNPKTSGNPPRKPLLHPQNPFFTPGVSFTRETRGGSAWREGWGRVFGRGRGWRDMGGAGTRQRCLISPRPRRTESGKKAKKEKKKRKKKKHKKEKKKDKHHKRAASPSSSASSPDRDER